MTIATWTDPCARIFVHSNNNGPITNTCVLVIKITLYYLVRGNSRQTFANEALLRFPLAPLELINISGAVL